VRPFACPESPADHWPMTTSTDPAPAPSTSRPRASAPPNAARPR
jgi:hypothetical protein